MGRTRKNVYACYKGDDLLMVGTIEEIAKGFGYKRSSLLSATCKNHKHKQNTKSKQLLLFKVEGEYEDV